MDKDEEQAGRHSTELTTKKPTLDTRRAVMESESAGMLERVNLAAFTGRPTMKLQRNSSYVKNGVKGRAILAVRRRVNGPPLLKLNLNSPPGKPASAPIVNNDSTWITIRKGSSEQVEKPGCKTLEPPAIRTFSPKSETLKYQQAFQPNRHHNSPRSQTLINKYNVQNRLHEIANKAPPSPLAKEPDEIQRGSNQRIVDPTNIRRRSLTKFAIDDQRRNHINRSGNSMMNPTNENRRSTLVERSQDSVINPARPINDNCRVTLEKYRDCLKIPGKAVCSTNEKQKTSVTERQGHVISPPKASCSTNDDRGLTLAEHRHQIITPRTSAMRPTNYNRGSALIQNRDQTTSPRTNMPCPTNVICGSVLTPNRDQIPAPRTRAMRPTNDNRCFILSQRQDQINSPRSTAMRPTDDNRGSALSQHQELANSGIVDAGNNRRSVLIQRREPTNNEITNAGSRRMTRPIQRSVSSCRIAYAKRLPARVQIPSRRVMISSAPLTYLR